MSEIFSCGYFEDPKLFLVSILWVQNVVVVFPGFEIFSRGYFVGPRFFLAGISRVRNFISFVFLESKIFYSGCFMGPRFFFLVGISRFWIFSRDIIIFNMSSSHDIFFSLILWNKLYN